MNGHYFGASFANALSRSMEMSKRELAAKRISEQKSRAELELEATRRAFQQSLKEYEVGEQVKQKELDRGQLKDLKKQELDQAKELAGNKLRSEEKIARDKANADAGTKEKKLSAKAIGLNNMIIRIDSELGSQLSAANPNKARVAELIAQKKHLTKSYYAEIGEDFPDDNTPSQPPAQRKQSLTNPEDFSFGAQYEQSLFRQPQTAVQPQTSGQPQPTPGGTPEIVIVEYNGQQYQLEKSRLNEALAKGYKLVK